MKKLIFILSLFLSFATASQTVTGDRIVARQSIYLRNYWIDSIQNDTAFQNRVKSVPTSDAVYRFVKGRVDYSISIINSLNFKFGHPTGDFRANEIRTFSGQNLYQFRWDSIRMQLDVGTNVASTNDLTLGMGGNTFGITGDVQINAITTTNWQEGSDIWLVFADTLTVKHNTTGGAGTVPILLAGNQDYITDINAMLYLKYYAGFWHEVTRKNTVGSYIFNQTTLQTSSNFHISGLGRTAITGSFSSPGAGLSSEKFGLNAVAPGAYGTSIGNGTNSGAGNSNTAVGTNTVISASLGGITAIGASISKSGSGNSTLAGTSITATGQGEVGMGYLLMLAGANNTTVGTQGNNQFDYSQAFGFAATTTAANQLVFGAADPVAGGINDAYFGRGVTSTAANNFKMQPTSASGTNMAGNTFTIAGSKATGDAVPGTIVFQTSIVGASGTTLQTLADRVIINGSGIIIPNGIMPTTGDAGDSVIKRRASDGQFYLALSAAGGSQTWQQTLTTGSTLTTNNTITMGTTTFTMNGSTTATQFEINNTVNGVAIKGINAGNNGAIWGETTIGQSFVAIGGENAELFDGTGTQSNTNTVRTLTNWSLNSSGVVAAGFGQAHRYLLETSTTNSILAARTVITWNDPTHISRTAWYDVYGLDNAVEERFINIQPTLIRFNNDADTVASKADARAGGGGGGGASWNGITNPTGNQALTFDAAESSVWTDNNTTVDLFTVNSSTGTTNSMFSFNRTGTALAAGNNIMELISSGANATNAITVTGLNISVTNTNATSGINKALVLGASGAATANYAIEVTAGQTILPAGTGTVPAVMLSTNVGLFNLNGTDLGIHSGTIARAWVGTNGVAFRDPTAIIDIGNAGLGNTNRFRISAPAVGTMQLGMESTQQAMIFKGANNAGTDVSGFLFTLQGSAGTGTGISGSVNIQTGIPTTTGTAVHTFGDRLSLIGKYTTLTESSATSFARVNIPTGTVAGGEVIVTIEANDATDFQARTLRFVWTAVNKAGTTTITIGTAEEVVSVSLGTLTATITTTDATGGNVDFKANAVSSLTQTVLRANCYVTKNFGTGTIIAQ